MNQEEENRLIKLNLLRNVIRRKRIPREVLEKMKKAIQIKESSLWPFAFMVGIFNDLVDLTIIGTIPILGDTLDLATSAILVPFMFSLGGKIRIKLTLLGLVISGLEFVPFPLTEMLSLWTVALIYGYYKAQQRAELAQRGLEKYQQGKIDREALAEFNQ